MSPSLKAIGIRTQAEPMSQLRVKGRNRAVSQLRDSWAEEFPLTPMRAGVLVLFRPFTEGMQPLTAGQGDLFYQSTHSNV